MITVIPYSGIPTAVIALSAWALDPATGDLALPITLLFGADAVLQKIRSRFRFFKGEWFLDTRLGVPYLQIVLVKNPDLILINAIFSKVLATTPGVASVDSFTCLLDRPTRTLTCTFQITLSDGTKVIAQAEPFIIG